MPHSSNIEPDTEPLEESGQPDSALIADPLWRAADLGKPIPDSPHAASVTMPLWEHVVRYEEHDPALLDQLRCGYPRFVFNPIVNALIGVCRKRFAREGELCLALPSRRIAERCARFLHDTSQFDARIEDYGLNEIHVVLFPEEAFAVAKQFWQHYGNIVSSRLAQDTLEQRAGTYGDTAAKTTLRDRIAGLTATNSQDVYLYASGMAALSGTLDTVRAHRPDAKTIQIGLPYVDLLKIQTKWGPRGDFYPDVTGDQFEALTWQIESGPVAAVYCEHPRNPLLQSTDLKQLSALLRKHNVPLVVDETLGTFLNLDLRPFADLIVTSLTKYFSGVGDVMAGSVIVNAQSPLYGALKRHHDALFEDRFWDKDAEVLESNSRDFESRMRRINANAEQLADYLHAHPKVQRVYYPKFECPEEYRAACKPGAGYGGMFSLVLKNGENAAPKFYDALRVSKGPSLGTNYTLACPYTLLAHFDELDWVESLGVPPHLVRVSVGIEDAKDLIGRFEQALNKA